MSATALERDLATDQTIPCLKCGGDTVTKMDAIGRTRQRCPRCEGVSRVRAVHPDEALVPQTLVRSSGHAELPAIAIGQLRCQRCARGVNGKDRFCAACRTDPLSMRTCTGCGYTRPRGRLENSKVMRCEHCPAVALVRLCLGCNRLSPRSGGAKTSKDCQHCRPPKEPSSARTYAPKSCARCTKEFQPTGPRALWCEDCRA